MKKDIYSYSDYREYLQDWVQSQPSGGRGVKSKIAATISHNSSYVTHVFNGTMDLSLEQAILLRDLLALTDDELEYFLLLVQKARAGNPVLQAHIQKKINEARAVARDLKNRLRDVRMLSDEFRAQYYSSWIYAAIHMLCMVKPGAAPQALAERLGIPLNKVIAAIDFLAQGGLITKKKGGVWQTTDARLHLPTDSPLVKNHHMNWRIRAIDSIDRYEGSDLHYSSVICISKQDAEEIRKVLFSAIESVRALAAPSPEEDVYAYNIDLFRI